MTHRLIGLAVGDGEIAECHVRPGIAVVELGGAMGEMCRNLLLPSGHPSHVERDKKRESQHAVRRRIVRMALDRCRRWRWPRRFRLR